MKKIHKIYLLLLSAFIASASYGQLSDLDLDNIDLDNLAGLATGGEETEPEPMEKINAKAEELSVQIKDAVTTLQNASSTEKIKQLDQVKDKIESALKRTRKILPI